MSAQTQKDIEMAKKCLTCPVCKRARIKQSGFAFWFVKNIEDGLCAYERVYGKKAHEKLS
jgi:hypothetical protein